jgi:hypothetical protein
MGGFILMPTVYWQRTSKGFVHHAYILAEGGYLEHYIDGMLE